MYTHPKNKLWTIVCDLICYLFVLIWYVFIRFFCIFVHLFHLFWKSIRWLKTPAFRSWVFSGILWVFPDGLDLSLFTARRPDETTHGPLRKVGAVAPSSFLNTAFLGTNAFVLKYFCLPSSVLFRSWFQLRTFIEVKFFIFSIGKVLVKLKY